MLQLTGHLILISTFVSFSTVFGFDVALFASTGCFSHDVTTREVGEEFAASANVSWLQIRAYKFDNLQPVQLPSEWHQLIVDRIGQSEAGEEGKEIHSLGQPLIWETYVPVDWMRPWDLRGTILFYSILELHHRFCAEFVQSEIFKSYLKQKRPDLVVIDHFLQECFMGAAAILNTTTVKYSNWPLADGYTSSINVPGNPATVPKTGTSFSSLGMDFGNRVRNTIFHGIIAIARHMQTIILKKAYAEWGHPNMDLDDAQALHLLYAGRAEFLVEPIRPISNRIKHFGCPKCKDKTHYEIQRPSFLQLPAIKLQIPNADSQISIVIDVHNRTRLVTNPIGLCTTDCPREKNYTLFNQTSSVIISSELTENLTESEKRYIHALNEFPDLNLLEEGPFVLISFGSVAEVSVKI
ncbi:Glucuronosyltransferase [Aphelenchoides besseyi]|nr:Glucuronosyltransferase [Aphelenchoides besseyi]